MEHYIKVHSVIKYAGMFYPVADIKEALALVIRYHIKAEIIGQWLYCFPPPLIAFQLETIGFWHSFKHGAFVYSGTDKELPAGLETLEEIRARLGSQKVTGGNYVWS